MNGVDYVEDSCAEFYPATVDSEVIRTSHRATITLVQMDHVTHHVTRRVIRHATHDRDNTEPWTVTQLQFTSWKMYDQVCTQHRGTDDELTCQSN